jgi:hypothetical protein
LNIKFEENAKFLEARPIRVIGMALNMEGCNGKKERENIFKVIGHWRGIKERRRTYDFLIYSIEMCRYKVIDK